MSESPRERRYEKNKNNILDAAQKLIAKKGYENVSLREIARKADYSPAGLYEYFESKDHLLASLRGRINKMLIETVQALPEYPSTKDQIVDMGLAYVSFAVNHTEFFNLLNSLPPLRLLKESPDPSSSPFTVFEKVVEKLMEELSFETQSGFGKTEITYSIWTFIHGMAALQVSHMQGFDADFEAINKNIIKIYFKGLEAELKGE